MDNSMEFMGLNILRSREDILVEALACGIPSISFNWLTGVEEIINKENGIIVNLKDRYRYYKGIDNAEDIENLSQAMKKLIRDPQLCENMSEKAVEIEKTRNIETILQKWDKEVEKID